MFPANSFIIGELDTTDVDFEAQIAIINEFGTADAFDAPVAFPSAAALPLQVGVRDRDVVVGSRVAHARTIAPIATPTNVG